VSGDLLAELLEMEHRFWQSSTDPAVYREHMADDGVMVFPYGVGVMDKDMVVYAIGANAEEWAAYDLLEPRAMPLGDDAALIVYKAVAERPDDEPFKAWVSSTYVRRDGRWMLACHQQTLAPAGAEGS